MLRVMLKCLSTLQDEAALFRFQLDEKPQEGLHSVSSLQVSDPAEFLVDQKKTLSVKQCPIFMHYQD